MSKLVTCCLFYQIGEQAFHNFIKYNSPVHQEHQCDSKSWWQWMQVRTERYKVRGNKNKLLRPCDATLLGQDTTSSYTQQQKNSSVNYQEHYLMKMDIHTKEIRTDKLASRYHTTVPPVFTAFLLIIPEVVIIDAMFIINTRPLCRENTFSDYVFFLFNQFVVQNFRLEVHLIFDKLNRQLFNSKQFEHKTTTCKKYQHYYNYECPKQLARVPPVPSV